MSGAYVYKMRMGRRQLNDKATTTAARSTSTKGSAAHSRATKSSNSTSKVHPKATSMSSLDDASPEVVQSTDEAMDAVDSSSSALANDATDSSFASTPTETTAPDLSWASYGSLASPTTSTTYSASSSEESIPSASDADTLQAFSMSDVGLKILSVNSDSPSSAATGQRNAEAQANHSVFGTSKNSPGWITLFCLLGVIGFAIITAAITFALRRKCRRRSRDARWFQEVDGEIQTASEKNDWVKVHDFADVPVLNKGDSLDADRWSWMQLGPPRSTEPTHLTPMMARVDRRASLNPAIPPLAPTRRIPVAPPMQPWEAPHPPLEPRYQTSPPVWTPLAPAPQVNYTPVVEDGPLSAVLKRHSVNNNGLYRSSSDVSSDSSHSSVWSSSTGITHKTAHSQAPSRRCVSASAAMLRLPSASSSDESFQSDRVSLFCERLSNGHAPRRASTVTASLTSGGTFGPAGQSWY